jgi:hypothetical protein
LALKPPVDVAPREGPIHPRTELTSFIHVLRLPPFIAHLRQALHDVVRREQITKTFKRQGAPTVLWDRRAATAHAARIASSLLPRELLL